MRDTTRNIADAIDAMQDDNFSRIIDEIDGITLRLEKLETRGRWMKRVFRRR